MWATLIFNFLEELWAWEGPKFKQIAKNGTKAKIYLKNFIEIFCHLFLNIEKWELL